MFDPKEYAYQIEVTLQAIFKCNKFELGGIADANFIAKYPFIAIAFAFGNYYNKVDPTFKEKIEEFLSVFYLDMGKSMEEIGEERVKKLVEDFKEIIATI
ncbi:MAG: hypothetical protein GXZ06_02330 [Tissierellia bacterium]|nr:hypothetical protein [Tissierellia bacterium]